MKKEIRRVEKREVTVIFQWFRDRLLGRHARPHLRFEQDISDRTQPDPILPEGPSHKLFGNYYYLRDARRLVDQPLAIAGPDIVKKLPLQESENKALTKSVIGIVPGKLYNPTDVPTMPIRDPAKLEKAQLEKAQQQKP